MIHLFYALGGGLGHFTRALRVIDYLDLVEPVDLLVSPQHRQWNLATPENVTIKILPKKCSHSGEATRLWFNSIVSKTRYDKLWIDAFPLGLFGEFQKQSPQLPINHIARILKSGPWLHGDFDISFQTSFVVEELSVDHWLFLQRHSQKVERIALPIEDPTIPEPIEAPYTVLSHSGPQAEVDQLIDLIDSSAKVLAAVATEVVVPDGYVRISTAKPWYRSAELIVSGCGFNTMSETLQYRDKHKMLPFKRRFDDQFFRADLRKESKSID